MLDAPVTSVRAVYGPPERRFCTERQQAEEHFEPNVPGAIIGGVLGGILGHQIGGASGKTVTPIGGAVGGAALGANIDRFRDPASGRDVGRCETTASAPPQYYAVVYYFRGVDHQVQMATPPGRTIPTNGKGEPRQWRQ